MKSTITYVAGYDPLSPAALRQEFAAVLGKLERGLAPKTPPRAPAAPRRRPCLILLPLHRHVLSSN